MALGHFFGGVTQGLESAERHTLRQRALDLQESGLVEAKRQARNQEIDARFGANETLHKSTLEAYSQQLGNNPFPLIKAAIGKIESGGQEAPYTLAVDAGKGRFAIGKYGILSTNIVPTDPTKLSWIKESGLGDMTVEQFRNSEAAQEHVADFKIRQLMNKYNNDPRKVAAEWLGGPNWQEKITSGTTDKFGTGILAYQTKFDQAFDAVVREDVEGMTKPFMDQMQKLGSKAAEAGYSVDLGPRLKSMKVAAMGVLTPIQEARLRAQEEALGVAAGAPVLGAADATRAQAKTAQLTAGGEGTPPTPPDQAGFLGGTAVQQQVPDRPFEDPSELMKMGLGLKHNPDGTVYINPDTSSVEIVELPGELMKRRREELAAAADREREQLKQSAERSLTAVDATTQLRRIVDANPNAVGTVSRFTQVLSTTDAAEVRGYVRSLKSPIALGAMEALKAQSKQGATGFGNMNEKELELLIDAMRTLDPDGSGKVFMRTLDNIERRFGSVLEDIRLNVSQEEIDKAGLRTLMQEYEDIRAPSGGAGPAATGNIRRYNPETGRIE